MEDNLDNPGMPDLAPTADLLRAERAELTALELDGLRQRVRRSGTRPMTRKAQFMKSRLALVAMLTVGMLMSLSGVGLAVSALSDDNSAAVSQYGTAGEAGTLGAEEGSGVDPSSNGGNNEGSNAVAGTQEQASTSTDDSLPFTGFAAIPLLLGGVALLTAGVVLRRRTSDEI